MSLPIQCVDLWFEFSDWLLVPEALNEQVSQQLGQPLL